MVFCQVYIDATTDAALLSGASQGYFLPVLPGVKSVKLMNIQYVGTDAIVLNQLVNLISPNFKTFGGYVSFLTNKSTADNCAFTNLTNLNIDLGQLPVGNYVNIRPLLPNGTLATFDYIILGFDIQ